VSGSADRASLTTGANPGFFRVVPSDAAQGPTIARYMVSVLRARRVVVVDDRSAYSVPLADKVQALLRASGVRVVRDSVAPGVIDFSGVFPKVTRNVDLIFLPWQKPGRAQSFGEQLRSARKHTTIFGSDGLYAPTFMISGSYVTLFAPDARRIAVATAVVRDYARRYGSRWSPLGTPTYVATQVMMAAIDRACADGRATRAEVRKFVARTNMRSSVLGVPISFTKSGDLRRGRFFVYRIIRGRFVFVQ
jgi:branched-chain amino acid transport system substrate-binding protein